MSSLMLSFMKTGYISLVLLAFLLLLVLDSPSKASEAKQAKVSDLDGFKFQISENENEIDDQKPISRGDKIRSREFESREYEEQQTKSELRPQIEPSTLKHSADERLDHAGSQNLARHEESDIRGSFHKGPLENDEAPDEKWLLAQSEFSEIHGKVEFEKGNGKVEDQGNHGKKESQLKGSDDLAIAGSEKLQNERASRIEALEHSSRFQTRGYEHEGQSWFKGVNKLEQPKRDDETLINEGVDLDADDRDDNKENNENESTSIDMEETGEKKEDDVEEEDGDEDEDEEGEREVTEEEEEEEEQEENDEPSNYTYNTGNKLKTKKPGSEEIDSERKRVTNEQLDSSKGSSSVRLTNKFDGTRHRESRKLSYSQDKIESKQANIRAKAQFSNSPNLSLLSQATSSQSSSSPSLRSSKIIKQAIREEFKGFSSPSPSPSLLSSSSSSSPGPFSIPSSMENTEGYNKPSGSIFGLTDGLGDIEGDDEEDENFSHGSKETSDGFVGENYDHDYDDDDDDDLDPVDDDQEKENGDGEDNFDRIQSNGERKVDEVGEHIDFFERKFHEIENEQADFSGQLNDDAISLKRNRSLFIGKRHHKRLNKQANKSSLLLLSSLPTNGLANVSNSNLNGTTNHSNNNSYNNKNFSKTSHSRLKSSLEAPKLERFYFGKMKENERIVELNPKIKVLNKVEICDVDLKPLKGSLSINEDMDLATFATSPTTTTSTLSSVFESYNNNNNSKRDESSFASFLVNSQIGSNQETDDSSSSSSPSSSSSLKTSPFSPESLPFVVSWIDRIKGEATIEATDEHSINCEKRSNYTFQLTVLGCNGLSSNSALVSVSIEDVNEFSPEFDRLVYTFKLDSLSDEEGRQEDEIDDIQNSTKPSAEERFLFKIQARDQDCSSEFGSVCRYELAPIGDIDQKQQTGQLSVFEQFRVDREGHVWLRDPERAKRTLKGSGRFNFLALAYDCGGKKSQLPATIQIQVSQEPRCRPSLKGFKPLILYQPGSGEWSPFDYVRIDLCEQKCHRANVSMLVQLQAATPNPVVIGAQSQMDKANQIVHPVSSSFHCDRDSYSMVSKRRLCASFVGKCCCCCLNLHQRERQQQHQHRSSNGAKSKSIELLPPYSALNRWIRPLHQVNQLERANIDLAEEDSLAAYSLEGSYGRKAIELLNSPEHVTSDGSQSTNGAKRSDPMANQSQENQSQDSTGFIATSGANARSNNNNYSKKIMKRFNGNGIHSASYNKVPRKKIESTNIYRDQVYRFDGLNSVLVVPASILQQSNSETYDFIFGKRSTISFWMRHGNVFTKPEQFHDNVRTEGSNDEHIICSTDSISNDRINFGLAIDSDCRLVLRMRTKFFKGSRSDDKQAEVVGQPSGWRWKLTRNEACDNKWHLYTLNVEYPKLELYIDGEQFEVNDGNPEIEIYEPSPWLQSQNNLVNSSNGTIRQEILSIGGCLENDSSGPIEQSAFGQFKGQLSGLIVLAHENDDSQTIQCLGHCSEALVSLSTTDEQDSIQHDQQSGPQQAALIHNMLDNSFVAYQESQWRIRLTGHDFLDIEMALGEIGYVNRRKLPSIGRRDIVVKTNIDCAMIPSVQQQQYENSNQTMIQQQFHSITIDPIRIQVEVLPSSSLPKIVISGTPNVAREYGALISGIQPFSQILIRIKRISLGPTIRNNQPNQSDHNDFSQKPIGPSNQKHNQLEVDYVEDSVQEEVKDSHKKRTNRKKIKSNEGESNTNHEGSSINSRWRRIEACTMRIYPPLNLQHEQIELPIKHLERLQLYWGQSQDGFVIYGLDGVHNYQQILRLVTYKNNEPARYKERQFKLICSDMNGRLVSNEYIQRVNVIHPRLSDQTTSLVDNINTNIVESLDKQYETSDSKFQALRISENSLPWVPIVHKDERYQNNQYMATNTRLDRIAMAFLVFVISLVVIMLLITLTNLKEPMSYQDSNNEFKEERASSILYYDIDSNGQQGNQVGCFLHPIPGFDDDEDDEIGAALQYDQLEYNENDSNTKKLNRSEYFELESLMWDDEPLESEPENEYESRENNTDSKCGHNDRITNIIVNPLLHGDELDQHSMDNDDEPMSGILVAEQRIDKYGSIKGSTRSYLANSAHEIPSNSVDQVQDENENEQLDSYVSDTASCSSASSIGCSVIEDSSEGELNQSDEGCRYRNCHQHNNPT